MLSSVRQGSFLKVTTLNRLHSAIYIASYNMSTMQMSFLHTSRRSWNGLANGQDRDDGDREYPHLDSRKD